MELCSAQVASCWCSLYSIASCGCFLVYIPVWDLLMHNPVLGAAIRVIVGLQALGWCLQCPAH